MKWPRAAGPFLAAAKLEVRLLIVLYSDRDGIGAVRDLIEQLRSSELENGLCAGVVNHRGVTVRLPTDGGAQERALASRYRKDAKTIAADWPQTAALLETIAKDFDRDGRREDQNVEAREWM